MTSSDIITLVVLAALFAAFTATMAWAEMMMQRHTAPRAAADLSTKRKRRPF